MNKICKQTSKIKEKIKVLENQLKEIQETCPHENAIVQKKIDTGNLCKNDDTYWVEVKCQDCGNHLRFDSKEHPSEYRYWVSVS